MPVGRQLEDVGLDPRLRGLLVRADEALRVGLERLGICEDRVVFHLDVAPELGDVGVDRRERVVGEGGGGRERREGERQGNECDEFVHARTLQPACQRCVSPA